MNQLFDKKYPVTSSLLLLTTGVFLAMLLLRGFDYESVQTVYDFGGVLGYEIQVDPSQSWRLLAAMFVHVGLQHFVLNMVTLYFIGRIAEDLFGSKAFLASTLLSGLMGNLFCIGFFSSCCCSWGFYRLVWNLWCHCQFALYRSKSLYSLSEPTLYFLDSDQYPL